MGTQLPCEGCSLILPCCPFVIKFHLDASTMCQQGKPEALHLLFRRVATRAVLHFVEQRQTRTHQLDILSSIPSTREDASMKYQGIHSSGDLKLKGYTTRHTPPLQGRNSGAFPNLPSRIHTSRRILPSLGSSPESSEYIISILVVLCQLGEMELAYLVASDFGCNEIQSLKKSDTKLLALGFGFNRNVFNVTLCSKQVQARKRKSATIGSHPDNKRTISSRPSMCQCQLVRRLHRR